MHQPKHQVRVYVDRSSVEILASCARETTTRHRDGRRRDPDILGFWSTDGGKDCQRVTPGGGGGSLITQGGERGAKALECECMLIAGAGRLEGR